MRLFALIACLVLMVSPALAGPFPGSDDYRQHLEVLGYQVQDGETGLVGKHDKYVNISLLPYEGGVLVVTFFKTTEKAKSDRVGFFQFLNSMNANAVAARYYEDNEGDVIVEGWYPGDYDRMRFGVFLDSFNSIGDDLGASPVTGDYLE